MPKRYLFAALTTALITASSALGQAMQEGFVDTGGARIHYTSTGQGPTMFLIHGFPLSGDYFKDNAPALSKNYQVITIDLRGFGQSTTDKADPGSVGTYANDAIAVMDKLGVKKAVIGGMSMGGQIALELYRKAPERFSGMVLIATLANPASITEQNLWKGISLQAQAYGVQSIVPELIKDMITGQDAAARPDLKKFLEGIMKQSSLEGIKQGTNALATRPDSLPTLKTIAVPTLIVVGREDTVYPVVFSLKMAQNIAGSKLVIVPGAAHAVNAESAAAANKAILDWAAQNIK